VAQLIGPGDYNVIAQFNTHRNGSLIDHAMLQLLSTPATVFVARGSAGLQG
jgi:hypothetical protein